MIQTSKAVRVALVATSLTLLGCVYITQQFSYSTFLFSGASDSPELKFIIDRTVRLLINDGLCISLIYALFQNRQHVRIATYLFLFELLLVLPVYFAVKITLEGPSEISSPLLSPIHRMIVNPLFMIILISAFYYQQYFAGKED